MHPQAISRRGLLLGAAAAGAGCGRPKATAFQGYCFVANQLGKSVTAIDLSRFRVRKRIPLDAEPAAVVAHPTATKVYVLAPENGTVYEIDGASLAISRKVKAGNTAVGMQLAPSGDVLWVLYRDPAALVELPLKTLKAQRRVRLHAAADSFDLSMTGMAAIARTADRTIALARLERAAVERTITMPEEPSILRFRKDGKQILVGSRLERLLTIFQVEPPQVLTRLPLPIEPQNFVFNADLGQMFISGKGMDAVVQVYPYRTEIAETMLAGRAPAGMAVTETPPFLLVTNPETNTLTILNFNNEGRKLVASVQVGEEPRSVLVTPDQQYALVLNEKSGDMAVVRLTPLATQDSPRRSKYPSPVFTIIPVGEKPVSAGVVAFT